MSFKTIINANERMFVYSTCFQCCHIERCYFRVIVQKSFLCDSEVILKWIFTSFNIFIITVTERLDKKKTVSKIIGIEQMSVPQLYNDLPLNIIRSFTTHHQKFESSHRSRILKRKIKTTRFIQSIVPAAASMLNTVISSIFAMWKTTSA